MATVAYRSGSLELFYSSDAGQLVLPVECVRATLGNVPGLSGIGTLNIGGSQCMPYGVFVLLAPESMREELVDIGKRYIGLGKRETSARP